MSANALSVIVPIRPGCLNELQALLATVNDEVRANPKAWFGGSVSTHFARWAILPAPAEASQVGDGGERLYFSSCFDGQFDAYVAELCAAIGPQMDPLWSFCESYSPGLSTQPAQFREFLSQRSFKPGIFLVAFPNCTVAQILRQEALRLEIETQLDKLSDSLSTTPIPDQNSSPTVGTSNPPPVDFLNSIVNALVGIRPGVVAANTDLTTQSSLIDMEDLFVQNQMTVVSRVKPGWWPRLVLRLFLALGSSHGKADAFGRLSGLTTIHFARWVLIDGGDNLLFESNYDGSWERYIDDFGDHAVTGMNAIWGTSVGYPKGGCLDIEAFKDVIRRHQFPTQVFYSAYPNLTVRNISSDRSASLPTSTGAAFAAGDYSLPEAP